MRNEKYQKAIKDLYHCLKNGVDDFDLLNQLFFNCLSAGHLYEEEIDIIFSDLKAMSESGLFDESK